MASATRVACDEEADGDGGKSNGKEGGGRATATRVMATEGKQQSASNGIDKGGRWLAREIHEATTQPRRWATTNDKSMRWMTMAATKRARVDRVMVTEIRVVGVGNEEGKGNNVKDGVGDEGGVQRRG
jgi:hypothetical protein